jgi:hypothetical protein
MSRYPSLPTMFHLPLRDLGMDLNLSSPRSSDKNKKERISNLSDNSHRLEEGEEGDDNHDQGKESLLGGKMLLQGYKPSSSSVPANLTQNVLRTYKDMDRTIDNKNLIFKNDNNNQKNEDNLSSKSGTSMQSDGDNDRAYINKAYTNNPMIFNRSLSPNHSPLKDPFLSLSHNHSPLEDPLLPLNSPITLENRNSNNNSYKSGMTNGVRTMTNGVSTMTNGISTMTNGVSTITNDISTMTNGISTMTNGINLGMFIKYLY